MQAAFYCDKVTKEVPVQEFLKQLVLSLGQRKDNCLSLMADIEEKVLSLCESANFQSSFVKKLHDCPGLYELRTRLDQSTLIRILFCRSESLIILLHGFTKPDRHDYNRRERTDVDHQIKIGQERLIQVLNHNYLIINFE
jgi:phage-related protein